MKGVLGWWRRRQNPLCRGSDRLEAWAALLLAAVLLLGVPTVGIAAGLASWEDGRARAEARARTLHQVPAETLRDAPPAVRGSDVSTPTHRIPVRWTDPDGTRHTDRAKVPAGTEQGTSVSVWLDHNGEVAKAPPTTDAVTLDAVSTGTGAALGAAVSALALWWAHRRVSLRRRLAEWERAWEQVGPEWGSQKS
ncbi:Rv1733c family protein [Streptomyces mesophilus]|uniref:Rv1733c family protein n=1 Tax=Streptomyces mesophilus TaxID=1775132 RepID=UPI00333139F5